MVLHCAVRFRAEQHRPPPSESFTTATSPILAARAALVLQVQFFNSSKEREHAREISP